MKLHFVFVGMNCGCGKSQNHEKIKLVFSYIYFLKFTKRNYSKTNRSRLRRSAIQHLKLLYQYFVALRLCIHFINYRTISRGLLRHLNFVRFRGATFLAKTNHSPFINYNSTEQLLNKIIKFALCIFNKKI